ncbi:hypothetical protein [Pelosinus propionicus]|uniref:Uncharacterized protein n=1 Tax=Pelosinus propionicus DSM 13327 TaxID=1123291 RepID=A0A1I4PKM2_9FIRM|nr:hypothetical protein [Pelosinus propionicus]SFM28204.1 hypothetical protein SAMN04490355_10663 [Pelosinus propionicus DSM 13327]
MRKLKSIFCFESLLDGLDFLTFMAQAPGIVQQAGIQKIDTFLAACSAAPSLLQSLLLHPAPPITIQIPVSIY